MTSVVEMDSVELADESQKFIELAKAAGPLDLAQPIDSIRGIIESASNSFRGDYIFEGAKSELMIPCDDGARQIHAVLLVPSKKETFSNIMLFFHGGGFVWGSTNTHMAFCEMISQLAPEFKYPACYEDAQQVARWCLENKSLLHSNDSCILGVCGDSAGGTIAASVCHSVKGFDYQVLIYPALDFNMDEPYQSMIQYGQDYLLTTTMMQWFSNHFFDSASDSFSELASPMSNKSFGDLPPALIIVAEFDPLADHSPAYKNKLEQAGVKAEMKILKGVIHGYVEKPGFFKLANKVTVEAIASFLSGLVSQHE